jgi:hypothetical protein
MKPDRPSHTLHSCTGGVLLLALASLAPSAPYERDADTFVLEIRTYTLKPGTGERFHQRFERESLPLLRKWKIDVVAYSRSLHDGDAYLLVRAFSTLADRDRKERSFYDSEAWRSGPRGAVLADIDAYNTAVVTVDQMTLDAIRRLHMSNVAGRR